MGLTIIREAVCMANTSLLFIRGFPCNISSDDVIALGYENILFSE